MKHKIYKGGVDNYPLWWYGQSNRLQNFGDRPNFLTPHGAMFQGNGYYFNSDNSDYMEDVYGRHLIEQGTNGLWSYIYLGNISLPACGCAIGSGDKIVFSAGQDPRITGNFSLLQQYCPNLTILNCRYNKVVTLDVSQIVSLIWLVCAGNSLSVLNVASLTSLELLNCNYNSITSLDVANLVNLDSLECSGNQISSLDVSQLVLLTSFKCYSNLISTLDVSNDSKIKTLDCHDNLMDQNTVDKVLVDANAWNTSNGTLDISGNTAPSQTGIDAKNDMVNRNWTVTTD